VPIHECNAKESETRNLEIVVVEVEVEVLMESSIMWYFWVVSVPTTVSFFGD
jgi:hypothetical protein